MGLNGEHRAAVVLYLLGDSLPWLPSRQHRGALRIPATSGSRPSEGGVLQVGGISGSLRKPEFSGSTWLWIDSEWKEVTRVVGPRRRQQPRWPLPL
jgi:hypothetical protein